MTIDHVRMAIVHADVMGLGQEALHDGAKRVLGQGHVPPHNGVLVGEDVLPESQNGQLIAPQVIHEGVVTTLKPRRHEAARALLVRDERQQTSGGRLVTGLDSDRPVPKEHGQDEGQLQPLAVVRILVHVHQVHDFPKKSVDHIVLVLGLALSQLQSRPCPSDLSLGHKLAQAAAVKGDADTLFPKVVRMNVVAGEGVPPPHPIAGGFKLVILGSHELHMTELPQRQRFIDLRISGLLLLIHLGAD
mmetsp:Transcript_36362/g.60736  ORF Transcript_36362/g.60736 Transcript_36362/m.60736 type:complete len:246 (-) Transcript_36362:2928-3665(-)